MSGAELWHAFTRNHACVHEDALSPLSVILYLHMAIVSCRVKTNLVDPRHFTLSSLSRVTSPSKDISSYRCGLG